MPPKFRFYSKTRREFLNPSSVFIKDGLVFESVRVMHPLHYLEYYWDWVEINVIIQESVGLNDCAKIPIFAGDIVIQKFDNSSDFGPEDMQWSKKRYEVVWHAPEYRFGLKELNSPYFTDIIDHLPRNYCNSDIKIVGNVFNDKLC